VATRQEREPWELKAEGLVRSVRILLDDTTVLQKTLVEAGWGPGPAEAQIRQLDAFCEALELELWAISDTPDRTLASHALGGIKAGAATVAAVVLTLGVSDLYHAVVGVEDQAERVIVECQIDGIDAPDPADPARTRGGSIVQPPVHRPTGGSFSDEFITGFDRQDDIPPEGTDVADGLAPASGDGPAASSARSARRASSYEAQHGRLVDVDQDDPVPMDDGPDVVDPRY
jgi:hypothetical protein